MDVLTGLMLSSFLGSQTNFGTIALNSGNNTLPVRSKFIIIFTAFIGFHDILSPNACMAPSETVAVLVPGGYKEIAVRAQSNGYTVTEIVRFLKDGLTVEGSGGSCFYFPA